MKLFFAPNTVAVASLIVLEEVGADYEPVRLDFKATEQQSASYLALNPKGRVPSLVTDQGILTETPAILNFLAARFGLTPLDPWTAAQVDEWNAYLCSTVHVAHAHLRRGHRWSDDPTVIDAMKLKVPQNMGDAFAYLEERFVGPFVFGGTFTTSDAYTFTIARWLKGDGVEIARFPKIAAHFARMEARPSVQKALAIAAGQLG
jgi:glutathione S-transferase